MNGRKILKYVIFLLATLSIIFGGINQTQPSAAMPTSPTDESKVPHYFGPYPNWVNSPVTNPDVNVEILGDGTGAMATATVGANGAVTGITITDPGVNYTFANVNITSSNPSATGATASATVTLSGIVTSVTVINGGAGYTQPVVTFSGGGGAVTPASVTPSATTDTYNVTVGSASGGTFTLAVNGVSTAAINWNALASDVQTALANIGFTAAVTGTGALGDPYVIVFAAPPTSFSMDGSLLTQVGTVPVLDAGATAGPTHTYLANVGSATGGTFLLTVDLATTAPIAWNALAGDVQTALFNAGVSATVSGSGSSVDPYVIVFAIAPGTVSMDSAALTQGVVDAAAIFVAANIYHVSVGSATGGTFLLTVDLATTAPIAWNALASDVQTALSTAGVAATVSGSGSVADPYVIAFATAPGAVSIDSAALTQGVPDTSVAPTADPAIFVVSAGSATGGSFTLNVDGTVSLPIAWNALAADVVNAFPAGFVTSVVDSGTGGPWTITFAVAPTSVTIDPAGLTRGVIDAAATFVAADIYNVHVGSATGGSFTLSVDAATTAPIAYNALAGDVQTALANAGVTATVTGSGSISFPWVIAFAVAPTSVTIDPAGLTQGVFDAGAVPSATSDTYNVTVGSATGGSFTLAVDGTSTLAIAWNALASDVQTALGNAGFTASVTGSGSTVDPYVVVLATPPASFTMDSTALTQSGTVPVLDAGFTPGLTHTYSATIGTATGGTFLLTVNAATTAPIAWNALAGDVQTALFNAGVTTTVSGSGSIADPWVIIFAVAPTSVSINGSGLTQPLVGATATAYGGVDAITLVDGGFGYQFPTVDFDMPDAPDGVQAMAHAVIDANGTITAVVLDNPGSGYSVAPHVVVRDGTLFDPIAHDPGTYAEAIATATLTVQSVVVDTFGGGYVTAPDVFIDEGDVNGIGAGASATASVSAGGVTNITLLTQGTGYITSGGIRKFLDPLPGLCVPPACPLTGKYIPVAVPEYKLYNGIEADEYEIAVVQYRTSFSSDLPPTLVRGYVQLETPANAAISQHYPLFNELLDGTQVPILKSDGITQWYAVTPPQWLGPTIIAEKDKPVRIVFYNLLPTGSDGDLFLPTDSSLMGSGMLPMDMPAPADLGSVMDEVRNPMCSEYPKSANCFKDDRATLHLHGGTSPWISDGTAHQWTTPAGESTVWPQGVSVSNVPDMDVCTAGNDGCLTFYYTNQQSARLLFYHDHSWGITRLNVYAGEAAGYLITDDTEQLLFGPSGTFASLGEGIPLVIQDRTFVPDAAQLALQDPTWDVTRWGTKGSFWYHHVYMPAQNPGDPGGMSAYGRWMYGPWFWPPAADTVYGPIANPYYDPNCNLDDPATWQYQTDPFCEPQQIPGTPNISVGMEQFNDTPIVNGIAYPTITLEPKTYRFRMLNAANDRFFNFQWYVADPTTASTDLNALGQTIGGTEVALKASEVAAAQLDPVVFPTPDTAISLPGPEWVHIGSEGGFLPKPVMVDGQQVTTWITDPTRFDVGNVDLHSLLLAPAERADVIVDFSQFAGQTLILYNDAPAAFPARVPSYDYYTGYPDMWPNGPSAILPGYGPNTRTIMQVKIAATTPATPFDQPGNVTTDGWARLQAAFRHNAYGTGVFEAGQHPIIVGQSAYNSAYGTNFATSSNCNAPGSILQRCDGLVRVNDTLNFGFNTLLAPNTKLTLPLQPKAIHDEMNATTFDEYGRMQANLGVEAQPPTPGAQNVTLYPFVNPATELIDATNLPKQNVAYDANGLPVSDIKITPISTSDGTQIWRITHNGVDTHPIHFHLYDVQVVNRVTWDNIIIPTEAGELGWKDTVRISPLEDTIVALRPIIPEVPFELPNAIRPLNPMMPIGSTAMFNNFDPQGIPTNPIINDLVNFGWEYVYHCHILSHEEMDMMRPVSVALPPNQPDGLSWVVTGTGSKTVLTLTWNDNSINETSFSVQRNDGVNGWVEIGISSSPLDQPNTHGTRTFNDTTFRWNGTSYAYRVVALNTIGYGLEFPSLTAQSISASVAAIKAPTNLTASVLVTPAVNLSWMDNSANETGFAVWRSTDGVSFTQIATAPAHNNTGVTGYTDASVVLGTTYFYKVAAVNALGSSAYSNSVTITVGVPDAPSNLLATGVRQGSNERVTFTWLDNSNNEANFVIQRATDINFTLNVVNYTVGANTTTFTTPNISNITYYFRIRATNALGVSNWADATPFPLPPAP